MGQTYFRKLQKSHCLLTKPPYSQDRKVHNIRMRILLAERNLNDIRKWIYHTKKIIEGEGKIWGRYPTVLDVPKGALGGGQKVQPGMPRSLRKGKHQAVVGSSARPFAQHWSVALCRVPPAWSNPSWASGACPGSPPFDSNPQDKGAFRSGSDPSSCLPPEVGCWSHFRLSPILRTQTSSPGVLPMVLPGPASISPDNREHITTITRSSSVHTTW